MNERFDSGKESCYLQYLDVNNLYDWAMSQSLPTGGFEWVRNPEQLKGCISKLPKKWSKGYLLEVDVSYHGNLYDLHNDPPLMCDRKKINRVQKLVPNLHDKKKYVIHIVGLNQALKHGLILKRIHQAIGFNQSAWLALYINFNTQLRTKTNNNFEKDFFKLMNNSLFGKTMKNIKKHKDINLVTNQEAYFKRMMKPNVKSVIPFSENLMGCEMEKISILMNKPVYLGQAILDLSKIIMYKFHYDYMLLKYGDNLRLCYMDTDSFVYDIKTDNFYKDIADYVEARFDTSGYSPSGIAQWVHSLPIGVNKKVIGLMKDEQGGRIMTKFVALRPKLYAFKMLNGGGHKMLVQGS